MLSTDPFRPYAAAGIEVLDLSGSIQTERPRFGCVIDDQRLLSTALLNPACGGDVPADWQFLLAMSV
jgi:hypothetical protein